MRTQNTLIMLIMALLSSVLCEEAYSTYQNAQPFIQEGKIIQGHIDNIYKEQSPHTTNRHYFYFLDYSYNIGHYRYTTTRHQINATGKYTGNTIRKEWNSSKNSDPIAIMYLPSDPKEHALIREGNPTEWKTMVILYSAIPAIFILGLLRLLIRTDMAYYLWWLSGSALVSVALVDKVFFPVFRGNAIGTEDALDIFFTMVLIWFTGLSWYSFFQLWRNGKWATAIVTDYSCLWGRMSMHCYTYLFTDHNGKQWRGKREDVFLFRPRWNVGDQVTILYNPSKPLINSWIKC